MEHSEETRRAVRTFYAQSAREKLDEGLAPTKIVQQLGSRLKDEFPNVADRTRRRWTSMFRDGKSIDGEAIAEYLPHVEGREPDNGYAEAEVPKQDRTPRKNKVEYTNDGKLVSRVEGRPLDLDDLLDIFEVDLDYWSVQGWNNWEQKPGQWLHQLKLKPRRDLIDAQGIIESLLDNLRNEEPDPVEAPAVSENRKRMLELNISDHHLGMLAWGVETRGEDWDSDIAERAYIQAVKELTAKTQHQPGGIEEALLVVGNDMLHVDMAAGDSSGGATTRGTIQDVDSRRKKLGRIIVRMIRRSVQFLLGECERVKLVVVPGNHDEDMSFNLGMVFEALYEGEQRVVVDNSPPARKYHQYGTVMLGFAHGANESKTRLPMIMPTEVPDMWSDTRHREWHIGHQHNKKSRGFVAETDEDMSVRIRIFPSLAPKDAWHAKKGYKAIRSAEGYMWHREDGYEGMFNSSPWDLK